jgi:hypothetical protein
MADIQVTVQLNDRASRQLRNIDKAANSVSRSLRTAGAALTALATGSVVRGIVSQYSAFEKYRSVLTTYLGSQKKANAELKRLQGLANALPQDLNDITQAFTILQRNGIDSSSASLTAFSNIATANGKSFTQLAEAVGDALTGEFERLKEFGIKVSKENDQFVARVGDQQVAISKSSTDLVRQLQTLGEEGGRFGNAAADNADTLNQSFSNLQGALFETSVTIMEELAPALKEVVDDTGNLLRNNAELTKAFGVGLGDAVRTAASGIKLIAANIDLIRNAALAYLGLRFANAFVNLAAKLSGAIKATQSLGGMFTTFNKVLKNTVTRIPIIGTALSSITTIMTRLGPALLTPWGLAATAIAGVGVALYSMRDKMVEVNGVVGSLGEYFRAAFDIAGEYVQTFTSYLKNSFFTFFDGFGNRINDFKRGFAAAFESIAGWAKKAGNFIINSFIAVGSTIIAVAKNIPEVFAAAFRAVLNLAATLTRSVTQKFVNLKDAMTMALTGDFAGAMAKAGESSGETFAESFASAFNDVPSLIDGVDYGAIFGKDSIGAGMDTLSDGVDRLRVRIGEYLSPAMETLSERVMQNRKEADLLKASTTQYDDAIIRTARDQKGLNTDLGVTNEKMNDLATKTTPAATVAIQNLFNPIQTIRDGLDSMVGRVSDTMADTLLGLGDGFKSLQDIAMDSLKMIISTLIQAFIRSKLLGQSLGGMGGGMGGGLLGGLGGALGGLGMSTLIPGFGLLAGAGMLLGGLFADGGNTAKAGRKPILVGERGPELFMPGQAGNVVPNEQLNSSGDPLTVNFTLNAIDTQTGVQFLLENKRVITGVIQEAYQRRGAQGPIG